MSGTSRKSPCVDCGQQSWGVRCRTCRDKAQRIRPDEDPRVRRFDRERSAPGLSRVQRDALARKWLKQRRLCAYCSRLASTVDHVIALSRGGTNYEGNLIPACKSCNSRKAHRLIIEFKNDRPASHTASPVSWSVSIRKPRQDPTPRLSKVWYIDCATCGERFTSRRVNRKYCDADCAYLSLLVLEHERTTCQVCGCSMKRRKGSRYCSQRCGRAAYRRSPNGRAARRRYRQKRRRSTPYAPQNLQTLSA